VSLSGTEDVVVTGTAAATDIDSTGLTYSIKVTGATNGAAAVDAKTGAYTYTPKADYNGDDKFVIVASDGALTAEQEVNVKLVAVNDAPVFATRRNFH
jgi:VCBS repeat-containing protein